MSAIENDPASHSRPTNTVSMCLSRDSRKVSKNFRIDVFSVSPENSKNDQGWLAASTEARAANNHSFTSLCSRGSTAISLLLSSPRCRRIAPLSKIEMSPSVSQGTGRTVGVQNAQPCGRGMRRFPRDMVIQPLRVPNAHVSHARSRAAFREPSRTWSESDWSFDGAYHNVSGTSAFSGRVFRLRVERKVVVCTRAWSCNQQ